MSVRQTRSRSLAQSTHVTVLKFSHALLGAATLCLGLGGPNVELARAQTAKKSGTDLGTPCSRCRIDVSKLVTLGESDLVLLPSSVEIDSRGRYWVAVPEDLTRVFDEKGRFVAAVGRKGHGPNEFVGPYGVVSAPGDSMLLFDVTGDRASLVDAQLKVGRQVRIPSMLFPVLALEWPQRVVASGMVLTPAAAGWPLHIGSLASDEFKAITSTGYSQGVLKPNAPTAQSQLLAPAGASEFWSADLLRYRVSRWSSAGKVLQTIERAPTWFSKPSDDWMGNPETPPPPRLTGLSQSRDGLLWLYYRVANATWRNGWPVIPKGTREVSSRKIKFERLFSTAIDVLDPRSGKLVAHLDVPDYVIVTLRNGDVVTYNVDDDDVPVLTVKRARLLR